MMANSLLGSWIDSDGIATLARDLLPSSSADLSHLPPSPAPLVLGDMSLGVTAPPTAALTAGQPVFTESVPEVDLVQLSSRLRELKEKLESRGLTPSSRKGPEAPSPKLEPLSPPVPIASSVWLEDLEPSVEASAPINHPIQPPSPPAESVSVVSSVSPLTPPQPLLSSIVGGVAKLPKHFIVPNGSLAIRIRALSDWIKAELLPDASFITDDQGRPLGETDAPPDMLAAGAVLGEAARKTRAMAGDEPSVVPVLYCPMASGHTLSLVPVDSGVGRFNIGIAAFRNLTVPEAQIVSRALIRIVEADE